MTVTIHFTPFSALPPTLSQQVSPPSLTRSHSSRRLASLALTEALSSLPPSLPLTAAVALLSSLSQQPSPLFPRSHRSSLLPPSLSPQLSPPSLTLTAAWPSLTLYCPNAYETMIVWFRSHQNHQVCTAL